MINKNIRNIYIIIILGDMMKEEITYKSSDGLTNIHAVIWKPSTEIKAILQISHGMVEHINRYEEFANTLNRNGILVAGNDHLGHGQSVIDKDHYGYFAKTNASKIVVEDVHSLTQILKNNYPNIPIILLGHSMGSFIARNYITTFSEDIQGCILIGSGYQSVFKMTMAKIITKITQFYHHGWFYRSPFLYNITTGSYHKKFEEGKTIPDCWLTTNLEAIELHRKDPLSQFRFTCNGYYTLFDLIQKATSKKYAKMIRANLPVLMLSGKDDPVGNFGKDIYKINKLYKGVGLQNITFKLYNGMRHELINEKENVLPISDIINFINKIKGE